MRSYWKHSASLILLAFASPAIAQTHARPSQPAARRSAAPKVESDSELTVTDSTGAKQTYPLPRVDPEWDWFVTPTDSHGLMRVMLNRGGGSHDQEVEFEWDGKSLTHTFTQSTIKKGPRSTWQRFEVWLPRPDNNRATEPRGGDVVTMNFTHLADDEIEATFSGTTHLENNSGPSSTFRVEGHIHLRRTGPHNEANGGPWRDCDPIVHDKLIGEEGRWPSECEVKFDQYLRKELTPAFAPMLPALAASGWKMSDAPSPGPIEIFARGGERSPYCFCYSARFDYNAGIAPGSLREKQFYQARDKLADELKAAMQQGGDPTAVRQRVLPVFHKLGELDNHTSLQITLEVNLGGEYFNVSYEQPPQVAPLPGGGYIVTTPYTTTNDDNGPQRPQKWVLLGAWQPVSIAGMKAVTRGLVKPGAPRLSVQNIRVVFTGDAQAADQAIQSINWQKVRDLITGAGPSNTSSAKAPAAVEALSGGTR